MFDFLVYDEIPKKSTLEIEPYKYKMVRGFQIEILWPEPLILSEWEEVEPCDMAFCGLMKSGDIQWKVKI